jgi:DNA-binding ferritin-like protein (Dps family)
MNQIRTKDTKQNMQDEGEELFPLKPVEHLESLLYQFVNLYERWSEDRQVAAKQGADIAKFIEAFKEEVERFETLEEEVREDIKTQIHTEAKNMAVYMGRTVVDAASKEMEPTVKRLQKTVDEAENTLSRYQGESRWMHWAMIGLMAVTSILTSLIVALWVMPKPMLPLSKDELSTYQSGEVLESVWPKLTSKQKQWFLDLAKSKAKNN